MTTDKEIQEAAEEVFKRTYHSSGKSVWDAANIAIKKAIVAAKEEANAGKEYRIAILEKDNEKLEFRVQELHARISDLHEQKSSLEIKNRNLDRRIVDLNSRTTELLQEISRLVEKLREKNAPKISWARQLWMDALARALRSKPSENTRPDRPGGVDNERVANTLAPAKKVDTVIFMNVTQSKDKFLAFMNNNRYPPPKNVPLPRVSDCFALVLTHIEERPDGTVSANFSLEAI